MHKLKQCNNVLFLDKVYVHISVFACEYNLCRWVIVICLTFDQAVCVLK